MKALDFFAGAGGLSTGATQAGAQVLMAINHWPRAVETHAANHPGTEHRCEDLGLTDMRLVPDHELFLAAPSCKGHTPARGKEKEHHDKERATAWCIVNCAEAKRARLLMIENVPEMRDWELYEVWKSALRWLGYALHEHIFNASEFGVPQDRERIIITGTLAKKPLVLVSPKLRARPASSFVDFSAGKWSAIDKPGRAPATLARIANGRRSFGSRFIAPYYGSGSGLTGRSLDRPIGTITTRARWAVVDGDRMRMLSVDETKAAMSFPADYDLKGNTVEQLAQLGNAVCPAMARNLVGQIMEAA